MRRRRRKTVRTFAKGLVIIVTTAILVFMQECIIGQFVTGSFERMFCVLAGTLLLEVIGYGFKAFFGKRNEEELKFRREMKEQEEEEKT